MNFVFQRALPLIFASASVTQAFIFTSGPTNNCDSLEIKWSGGQAPFQLFMSPIFGTPRNVTIPRTAQGSYLVPQLPFAKDQQILLTMSDATGFGTGGTSGILTVGASTSGVNCNDTDPGVQFYFELPSTLQQCQPFRFEGYSKAIQPVTISVLSPGRQPQVLHAPPGDHYDWTANIAAGTPVIFVMIDGAGQQGGASKIQNVGATSDSSCLSKSSPTTTTGRQRPLPTQTSKDPSQSSSSSAKFGIGALAGTVGAGLVALALLISLCLFFLKRRRSAYLNTSGQPSWRPDIDGTSYNMAPTSSPANPYATPTSPGSVSTALLASQPPMTPYAQNAYPGNMDSSSLYPGNATPTTPYAANPRPPSSYGGNMTMQDPYAANPYTPPSFSSFGAYGAPDASASQAPLYPTPDQYRFNAPSASAPSMPTPVVMGMTHASNPSYRESAGSNTSSAARPKGEKAQEAQSQQQPRYVMHADLDEVEAPNADGVIELPPQYSERRVPLAGLPGHEVGTSGSAAHLPPQQPQSRTHSRNLSPDGLAYLAE